MLSEAEIDELRECSHPSLVESVLAAVVEGERAGRAAEVER